MLFKRELVLILSGLISGILLYVGHTQLIIFRADRFDNLAIQFDNLKSYVMQNLALVNFTMPLKVK